MKVSFGLIQVLIACLIAAHSLSTASAQADSPKPNVVLIVIDTLGARYLGAGKTGASDSPAIDKLASGGVTFSRAYSTSSWTKPSIASMFTSQYPREHQVTSIHAPFKPSRSVLAERLQQAGYFTAGVVSHTLVAPKSGFGRGFDSYHMVKLTKNVHNSITSHQVSADSLELLSKHLSSNPRKPFFLFCHYFDPHYDYQHHPRFNRTSGYIGPIKPGQDIRELRKLIPSLTNSDKEYLKNLYREEIAYTDEQIGKVLSFLDQNNLSSNTLVVLTADHGEEFFEHGWLGHTRTLYEELVNVPLIMRGPGIAAGRSISAPVSIIDIMPTVLSAIGDSQALDEGLEGISLLPHTAREASEPPLRDLFLEVDFRSEAITASKLAVVRDSMKLIRDKATGGHELFDVIADPNELAEISSKTAQVTATLKGVLDSFGARWSHKPPPNHAYSKPPSETTPQEVEQLKSLGYL